MVMKLLSKLGKTINKLLSYFNLSIQRKDSAHEGYKYKKEDYIWNKVSMLPDVPTIIDIGIGPTGTPGLYKFFPKSRYVFIDPLVECKKSVESKLKKGGIFINCAVGSENTATEINIARKPSRSSFFKRTHSYQSMGVDSRLVLIRRLDDILNELNLETPYGVKIDTEGYELEVMKGASEAFKKSLFVIVEFHFKDAIKNSYTLQDLLSSMEKAGFIAYFMLRDGRNIVFIKRDEIINNTKISSSVRHV